MSGRPDIRSLLAQDERILALVGSADRIIVGNPTEKAPYSPPLLLIEIARGAPILEGETSVIAEIWECTIGMIAEGCANELADHVDAAMEEIGFRHEATVRHAAGRPEWSRLVSRYSGARMR